MTHPNGAGPTCAVRLCAAGLTCAVRPCRVPQVPDDAREMVLDARSDEFFRTHAPLTFGEVGLSVKALLEQYQSREAQHRQVRLQGHRPVPAARWQNREPGEGLAGRVPTSSQPMASATAPNQCRFALVRRWSLWMTCAALWRSTWSSRACSPT